jgi:ketosteroid isomerase-like protein
MQGMKTIVSAVTFASAVMGLACSPALAEEHVQEGYAPIPEFVVFGEAADDRDSEAIFNLMRRFGQAWGSQDVDGLMTVYAEDAEWTNAFGDVRRGHDELREQFTWLFKRFESGEDAGDEEETQEDESTEPEMKRGSISLRYLGDDAAVFHTYTESNWGVNRDGDGLRRVYVSYVLEKKDGAWLIAHQTITDARR